MKKRIISLLLMIVMIVSIVPMGTFSASAASLATSFTPRLSAPTGGIYKGYWSNNCARYSYWRAYEILGYPIGWGGTLTGGRAWSELQGFPKSSNTPKIGALACWSGHIGVVESIDTAHRTLIISEGHSYSRVKGLDGAVYDGKNVVGYSTNTIGGKGAGTWWCKSAYNYDSAGRLSSETSRGCFYGYVYLVVDNPTAPTPTPTPAPSKPSLASVSATNVAKGKTVTFSWNATDRATGYKVAIRGAETKDIDVGNATSYSCVLNNSGTYNFYAMAYNSTGNSGWTSDYRSCTAHDPVTVKFIDWDGTAIGAPITVDYGGSAKLPVLNPREGYDFQGWEGTYTNVTSDSVVKATYKIKTYTVNFLDKSGKVIKSEKVNYGNDATPPTNTCAPTGYEFCGWSSEKYKNVYTDAANQTINVSAIYKWANDDLPIICNITSAHRQNDGYYVKFDLTNYDKQLTRGRAVVSLKTAEGKLVDSAESTAFSIPIDSTKKDIEVYIPCDLAATKAEVIVVNSYSSGVPISEKKIATVDNALGISAWSNIKPIADEKDIDTRVVYSSRDKIKTTGNTKTLSGYIWDGTYSSNTGNWSAWQDPYIGKIDFTVGNSYSREVETRIEKVYSPCTLYCYYHFFKSGAGEHTYCPTSHKAGAWHQINVMDSAMEHYGQSSCNSYYAKYRGPACPQCGQTQYWFRSINQNVDAIPGTYESGTKTQYRYRDTNYIYNFYKWSDWSEWSPESVEAIDGQREVKTETQYRNLNASAITENNSGEERTISGTLSAEYAGKQITLYVYGWIGASDFTNQYIGQSVVGEDGSYSFTFKLLNEPTKESGDYTVSIGIEGTTDIIEIGKIEAPIPTYSVKFYNWDGTILSEQTVNEGNAAVLPENPEREGYNFIGWDNSITNIKEDIELNPVFEKKQFTVTFIDWKNKAFVQQKFSYGDVLTPPDHSSVEGYNFDGWDKIIDGNFVVTEDMVVTAEYSKKSYSVKFVGLDGEVIDDQTIKFGEDAVAPDNAGTSDDGKIFAGWQDAGYTDVNGDAYVYPIYYYETTTDVPTITYDKDGVQTECISGEYSEPITVTLSTDDSNDVIYYTLSTNPEEEIQYTEPFVIDRTCSITYYATGFGKNDSETMINYYCINTGNNMTDWMTLEELPEDVRTAVDQENSDFIVEKETGYKFKNVTQTSDAATAQSLVENGWTLYDTVYTDFTDWQSEKIEADASKLGFEIETNNGAEGGQEYRYKYTRYKYKDTDGTIKYSIEPIEGIECELEEMFLDEKINIDPELYCYVYNGEPWYTREKIMTEYRSRYQLSSYYKWTAWDIVPPISSDTREVEVADVYRYTNANYHIVTVYLFEMYPEKIFVRDGETLDTSSFNSIHGYDYRGVYTDEDLTTVFATNTAVDKSMELYAKYTPKTYTVTFRLPNGLVIDKQNVEYMNSASDPGSDEIEGYVFGGWDKDFSCITEDTIVTGRYYKESEYPRVSLNRSSVVLYTGTYFNLVATITPADLTEEEIEWSSSDSSVASVDENGQVSALKAGQTVITATVKENKETASCTITVQPDLASKIMFKDGSKLDRDDIGYIRRVKLGTSVAEVRNEFINDSLVFVKTDKNGNEVVLNDTDTVGTGTVIRLMDGTATVEEAKLVIVGDNDGDGKLTLKDSTWIMQYILDTLDKNAAPYQIASADVNGDGFVNNKDAALIARCVAEVDTITVV